VRNRPRLEKLGDGFRKWFEHTDNHVLVGTVEFSTIVRRRENDRIIRFIKDGFDIVRRRPDDSFISSILIPDKLVSARSKLNKSYSPDEKVDNYDTPTPAEELVDEMRLRSYAQTS